MKAAQTVQEAMSRRDLAAAKSLRGYAAHYDKLHRDIADDLRRGAEALEERAAKPAPIPGGVLGVCLFAYLLAVVAAAFI